MWDNFPILFFTKKKNRVNYYTHKDGIDICIDGKCVFRMIYVHSNIMMRGIRSPLAIYDNSINSEDIDEIKARSALTFKYEGKNENTA